MKVKGKNYRTIWLKGKTVFYIDQNLLPFQLKIQQAKNYLAPCQAIKTMALRGAGAIGAAAGFALTQAFLQAPKNNFWPYINQAKKDIENTRPTAQNLFYATNRVYQAAKSSEKPEKTAIAEAQKIANEDAEAGRKIIFFGSIK